MTTPLSDNLRAIADKFPSRRDEIVEKARAFDEATEGYYGEPQTVTAPKFLGCYARARKLYCELTGKPLV